MAGRAKRGMTGAERQAAYRARRPKAKNGGDRQINTWVTFGTFIALQRLAIRYGVTQRALLERMITDADDKVVAKLRGKSRELDAYIHWHKTPAGERPRRTQRGFRELESWRVA